jgi:hypothetical protein
MLKKIISGGQTGADRAALAFALKFNIPHGDWIPKGRIAEDGPLLDKYQLQEMPTASYPARTEQNVIDSDGTVIFSRGAPTGGTDHTRKMVLKQKKQLVHIDLKLKTSYDAAYRILSWIEFYHINILNVAGPRPSKDPAVYNDVFKILDMAYKIHRVDQIRNLDKLPKTVDEAVNKLIADLPLKDKTTVAKMAEKDLMTLQITLGSYSGSEFGVWTGNAELLYSCKRASGDLHIDPDHAPTVII